MNKLLNTLCILISSTAFGLTVNVADYGANGSDRKDDTFAFQRAADVLASNGGGIMEIPRGVYLISKVKFLTKKYSNISIYGNGSTIQQFFPRQRKLIERWNTFSDVNAADGCFLFDAQVSKQFDDTHSIKNILIDDLHFVSDVEKLKFDELSHQISAHGVSNFVVQNCTFTGFLGDGISINAGTDFTKNYGAYNKNVTIRNCEFDGINRENRQGISFYYCDGFLVENCSFKNITREDMPGAIDVEPMDNWQVARNGIIRNCSFENIGGIAAVVIFLMPDSAEIQTKSNHGYIIENCSFKDVRAPLAVIGHDGFSRYTEADPRVIFRKSTVQNYVRAIDSRKAYNVLFDDISYNTQKRNYLDLYGEPNIGGNIRFKGVSFDNYAADKGVTFGGNSRSIKFENLTLKRKLN